MHHFNHSYNHRWRNSTIQESSQYSIQSFGFNIIFIRAVAGALCGAISVNVIDAPTGLLRCRSYGAVPRAKPRSGGMPSGVFVSASLDEQFQQRAARQAESMYAPRHASHTSPHSEGNTNSTFAISFLHFSVIPFLHLYI